MEEIPRRLQEVVDLFLAGKLSGFSHARHVAVARILKHYPYGRELMHLGLQVTATRAGVPEKYSAEITDRCWAEVPVGLPEVAEFDDTGGQRAGSGAAVGLPRSLSQGARR